MKKLFIIPALLGAMMFTSCEGFLDVNYTKDSPITTSEAIILLISSPEPGFNKLPNINDIIIAMAVVDR